jgi:hypothetical protein
MALSGLVDEHGARMPTVGNRPPGTRGLERLRTHRRENLPDRAGDFSPTHASGGERSRVRARPPARG